jgi:hypothetical protein
VFIYIPVPVVYLVPFNAFLVHLQTPIATCSVSALGPLRCVSQVHLLRPPTRLTTCFDFTQVVRPLAPFIIATGIAFYGVVKMQEMGVSSEFSACGWSSGIGCLT